MNEQFPSHSSARDPKDDGELIQTIAEVLQETDSGDNRLSEEELKDTASVLIARAREKGDEVNLDEIREGVDKIISARKEIRVSRTHVTVNNGDVIPVDKGAESLRDVVEQYSVGKNEEQR